MQCGECTSISPNHSIRSMLRSTTMSDSPNITLVRRLYDSGMAPDLVWDITPGFPNSGVYHGWESVGRDFFGPMLPDFESFSAVAEQFYADDEGHVFAYGHYHATPKGGS